MKNVYIPLSVHIQLYQKYSIQVSVEDFVQQHMILYKYTFGLKVGSQTPEFEKPVFGYLVRFSNVPLSSR